MLALIEKRNNHLEKIYEGGGKKAQEGCQREEGANDNASRQ